ncbi:hypothetical protein NDA11_002775 [Ustilago hordei]|nr:hypothetical protein NDA11_002775 [Ustilago hordei]
MEPLPNLTIGLTSLLLKLAFLIQQNCLPSSPKKLIFISLDHTTFFQSSTVMSFNEEANMTRLEFFQPAPCHGPGCSRSRRVTGSYGRSTGIEDLVEISREHGRSAVSMETMDSYGLTCKGGPSTATRRTKLKEQAQPRRGPSSRSMQMVTAQGLERQEPKELSLIKGGGAVSKESTPGHEEEEQCRRT